MRAALLVVAALVAVVLFRLLRRSAPEPPDDPMSQPFLDSRNSATYLYNRLTGVVTSYN